MTKQKKGIFINYIILPILNFDEFKSYYNLGI